MRNVVAHAFALFLAAVILLNAAVKVMLFVSAWTLDRPVPYPPARTYTATK